MIDLQDKNILITGGGGNGIASGICKVLNDQGARLIINDLKTENLEEVLDRYPKTIPVVGDIRNPGDIENIFNFIKEEVGILHGLVNNAGIGLNKAAHMTSEEEFLNLYEVDIIGAWRVSRFFVNQLIENGLTGNIVNVSSVHAHSTMDGYGIYASAKSAIEGLTRGMAVELGNYGIRINAIAPGYVHALQNYDLISVWTEDPHRWIQHFVEHEQAIPKTIEPTDCGNLVAFLLSEFSNSITGQIIRIDNGLTIKLTGAMPS